MSISTPLKRFLDEKQIPYSVMTNAKAYTAECSRIHVQASSNTAFEGVSGVSALADGRRQHGVPARVFLKKRRAFTRACREERAQALRRA